MVGVGTDVGTGGVGVADIVGEGVCAGLGACDATSAPGVVGT
jgi:hypothetical protein